MAIYRTVRLVNLTSIASYTQVRILSIPDQSHRARSDLYKSSQARYSAWDSGASFTGNRFARLIVSVPVEIVEEVDELIGQRPGHWRPFGGTHPARRNRSEFVRLAIVEKLERDKKLNT